MGLRLSMFSWPTTPVTPKEATPGLEVIDSFGRRDQPDVAALKRLSKELLELMNLTQVRAIAMVNEEVEQEVRPTYLAWLKETACTSKVLKVFVFQFS